MAFWRNGSKEIRGKLIKFPSEEDPEQGPGSHCMGGSGWMDGANILENKCRKNSLRT